MTTYNIHIPQHPDHLPSGKDGVFVDNALNIAQTVGSICVVMALLALLVFCIAQFGIGALIMFVFGLLAFVVVALPVIFIGSLVLGFIGAALGRSGT